MTAITMVWVDDEIHTSDPLIEMAAKLEKLGVQVVRLDNPDSAMRHLMESKCDLVVLDLHFGRSFQNGVQLAREIRAIGVRTPLVALTAHLPRYQSELEESPFLLTLSKADFLGRDDAAAFFMAKLIQDLPGFPPQGDAGRHACVRRCFDVTSVWVSGAQEMIRRFFHRLRSLHTPGNAPTVSKERTGISNEEVHA